MKKTVLVLCAASMYISVNAQTADRLTEREIRRVLENVEQNNAALEASRSLTDALSLEARTGNSLRNPEVEFSHKWSDPTSLGNVIEVTATQEFDFPSSYIYRNRMARSLAERYGYEYALSRQKLLLETQSLCIEIIALRQRHGFLKKMALNAFNIRDIVTRAYKAGSANILEANKASYEFIATENIFKSNEIELLAALKRLANLNGGQQPEFDATEFPSLVELPPLAEIIATYERMSPELLAFLSGKSVAGYDVKLSRSMALPKLSAGFVHESTRGEKFNGVVVGMSIPMFGNRNNVKRAIAQSQYAEAQYRSGVLDMRVELEKLYAQAEMLSAMIGEHSRMTEYSQSIELLNKAVDAGQMPMHRYFDELQPIYDARMALIEFERDYHLAVARINMIDL